MDGERKQHCWECRRRCLVCDFTEPACKRCLAAGLCCPGYNETPPLRLKWLEPGRVKSRAPKSAKGPAKADDCREVSRDSVKPALTPHLADGVDLNLLVEAADYCECVALHQCLMAMLILGPDNGRIYPTLAQMNELGSNAAIYPISPKVFQAGLRHPNHVRLVIVCMSLSHRMNQIEGGPACNSLLQNFFHHRGLMIHSLKRDLAQNERSASSYIVAGILTLVLVDVQHGTSLHWRSHMNAVSQVVKLSGGVRSFGRMKGAGSLLVCYALILVLGETTSSACELVTANDHVFEDIDFVIQSYSSDGTFAFQWPKRLFIEVLRINVLRARAASRHAKSEETPKPNDLAHQASGILRRIRSFSPAKWAAGRLSLSPSQQQSWTNLGKTYQAAVAVYCLSSLSSAEVLPPSQMPALTSVWLPQLHCQLLSVASSYQRKAIEKLLLWPLVVLGVESINSATSLRAFVSRNLSDKAFTGGSHAPIAAKNILEGYWRLGEGNEGCERRWDACFRDPSSLFTVPIAVDVSGLGFYGRRNED